MDDSCDMAATFPFRKRYLNSWAKVPARLVLGETTISSRFSISWRIFDSSYQLNLFLDGVR